MIRNAVQDVRTKKLFSAFGTTTGFQRFVLGLIGGLVTVGTVAAVLMPPGSATRAPRASLELLASIVIDSIPVMSVESVSLSGIGALSTGPGVSQVAAKLSYDLDAVIDGESGVPRIFLTSMPHDLNEVQETSQRKAFFFKSILPLVLQVNEDLRADRARLLVLQQVTRDGRKPKAADRLWLAMMSDRYGVDRDDISGLLNRVDIIPPSMALAQAAAESGWGTSRFAREGNALFGQWTFAEGNLVPEGRDDDKGHMVKKFNRLIDSVRGYALNLNTNRAYREFRDLRADLRHKGKRLDGRALVGKLHRYSERGVDYVNEIRSLISFNKLNRLDGVHLSGGTEQDV